MTTRRNRKLFIGAAVGTLAGMAVMMFDKETREDFLKKSKSCGQSTMRWIQGVKQDPQAFMNNVKEGADHLSKSFKEVANNVQKVMTQLNEVKETSTKVIETAKDAGEEMKEVSSKFVQMNPNADGGAASQSLLEKGGTSAKLH